MHQLTGGTHGRRAALTSLAACLAFLSACAQPPAAGPDSDAAAERLFEQLITRIYGSLEDRSNADRLMHENIQAAVRTCMRTQDQQYTPAPYQGIAGGPVVPGDVTFIAKLGSDFGLATGKQTVAEGVSRATNPGFEDLITAAQQEVYFDALDVCGRAGAEYEESYHPASQSDLALPFESILTTAQKSFVVQAEMGPYEDCLARSGIAADYLGLWSLAEARFPAVELPWEQLRKRPDWAAAVQYERELATADASCRADMRAAGLTAAVADLQQFAETHAEGLLNLDSEWAQIRTDVTAAGLSD